MSKTKFNIYLTSFFHAACHYHIYITTPPCCIWLFNKQLNMFSIGSKEMRGMTCFKLRFRKGFIIITEVGWKKLWLHSSLDVKIISPKRIQSFSRQGYCRRQSILFPLIFTSLVMVKRVNDDQNLIKDCCLMSFNHHH